MSKKVNSSRPLATPAPTRRGILKTLLAAGTCLVGLSVVDKVSALTGAKASESVAASVREPTSEGYDPAAPQVAFKSWTFGEIRRGDCTIANGGTFYLYANGSQRWTCNVSSTDTGDEWDGRFNIFNAQGQHIATTPGFHFDISVSNQSRHWDETHGPDAALSAAFGPASGISFSCSC